MTPLSTEGKRFSRYGMIGVVNNLVLYGLFVVLIAMSVSPVVAAGICYGLGVAASYLLNRIWTFDSANSHARDLPRFLMAYGVGLVSTMVAIRVLTIWIPPELAQVFNILLTAVVIYAMLRILRFGTNGNDHAH